MSKSNITKNIDSKNKTSRDALSAKLKYKLKDLSDEQLKADISLLKKLSLIDPFNELEREHIELLNKFSIPYRNPYSLTNYLIFLNEEYLLEYNSRNLKN